MKVGVGKVVITPDESLWLGGYAHRDRPSEGILHDLLGKAMALEDEEGARSVLVATDLLGLPREVTMAAASQVEETFGIPRNHLLLTSSHTHSGPVLRGGLASIYDLDDEQTARITRYTDRLIALLVEAVGKALDDLEPARLFHGLGHAGFAVNRREYTLEGIVIGRNPIGPTDPDVPVLRVDRADGSAKAIVFGYACHNTVLDLCLFSGDYAGFAQADLESRIPGVTALFLAGCAGDQNPHPRRSIELAERHGHELASAVLAVMDGEMTETTGPLKAEYEEIPLGIEEPAVRACLEAPGSGRDDPLLEKACRLLDALKSNSDRSSVYPYPVQVWRFADGFQMTALGGEAVVDYSLLLKNELGSANHWVVSYANDVMAYIPSLRVLREGGYEGDLSMIFYGFAGLWAPTIEQDILAAVRRLTEGLK